jgi:nitrite reductase/ring-hydroxylating ferredoxin subunit
MDFERTVSLDSLVPGRPTACRLEGGTPVCLVRVGDAVYALEDRCSHAEFPISDGDMVDDLVLECPLHGAQFDVRTGEALEPPAEAPIASYEVRIADGAVWVRKT